MEGKGDEGNGEKGGREKRVGRDRGGGQWREIVTRC